MKCLYSCTLLIGLTATLGASAQIGSIDSAVVMPRVFNDIPGATLVVNNNYANGISLTEGKVSAPTGFANRDVWYLSNNGTTPYQFQAGDYFNASFTVTLTQNNPNNKDMEAGWLFSNPSGGFGGDLQSIVNPANGTVAQFGGPSYYPFSPAAGGYPKFPGAPSVPNYGAGDTYTMGLNYVVDPNTGMPAFQYSVNGVYAQSSAGDTYFDLGPGQSIGGTGDFLGGYFQIANDPANPDQSGMALFGHVSITAVPEPGTFALVGFGLLALVLRRRS
jgi:PEP-CTERM motif